MNPRYSVPLVLTALALAGGVMVACSGGDDAGGGDGSTRRPPVGTIDFSGEVIDMAVDWSMYDLLPYCTPGDLRCRQAKCAEGQATTLVGKVYIPAGKLPLYNAVVYVPSSFNPDTGLAELEAFPAGVQCDTCNAKIKNVLTAALTNESGSFVLNDVPFGEDVPLVIQIGRWRRQVKIPLVEPCIENTLPSSNLSRLPRNRSEGEIPQMALVTGSADPFECLLRKIGIDDKEITPPSGKGRVHLYRHNGLDTIPDAPLGADLYGKLATLKKYDVVMLPCEGSAVMRSALEMENLLKFTSAGGRVFTTHFSYTWLAGGPEPFPQTGDWQPAQGTPQPDPFPSLVDQTFPKGRAFAQWLLNVGASGKKGELSIVDARHDLNSAKKPISQRWLYGDDKKGATPNVTLHMTFNTPVNLNPPPPPDPDGGVAGPPQCGRVVFSDFHVSTDAINLGVSDFPAACKGGEMTAQEKALTFMLFDLSACIMQDDKPPEPPIP